MKGYNPTTGLGFIQEGSVLPVAAPYNVLSGGGLLLGGIFGVAITDALQGAEVEIKRRGVFGMTKNTGAGSGGAAGDPAYWDAGTKKITAVSSGNTKVGFFVAACTDNAGTCRVLLP